MNAITTLKRNTSTVHHADTTPTRPTTTAAPPQQRQGSADRKAALQDVYDRHIEQIYKFVYFKVGNREDAEDITSQVFIKAAHSLDGTQQDVTKLAWLYRVARTTITDHWRGYYKGPTSSLDEMEEASPMHLAAPPTVLEDPTGETPDLASERVQGLLSILPENYRRVLQLRFLQGCSLKETATAMQITESNAKVLQHRAIQKALKMGADILNI